MRLFFHYHSAFERCFIFCDELLTFERVHVLSFELGKRWKGSFAVFPAWEKLKRFICRHSSLGKVERVHWNPRLPPNKQSERLAFDVPCNARDVVSNFVVLTFSFRQSLINHGGKPIVVGNRSEVSRGQSGVSRGQSGSVGGQFYFICCQMPISTVRSVGVTRPGVVDLVHATGVSGVSVFFNFWKK